MSGGQYQNQRGGGQNSRQQVASISSGSLQADSKTGAVPNKKVELIDFEQIKLGEFVSKYGSKSKPRSQRRQETKPKREKKQRVWIRDLKRRQAVLTMLEGPLESKLKDTTWEDVENMLKSTFFPNKGKNKRKKVPDSVLGVVQPEKEVPEPEPKPEAKKLSSRKIRSENFHKFRENTLKEIEAWKVSELQAKNEELLKMIKQRADEQKFDDKGRPMVDENLKLFDPINHEELQLDLNQNKDEQKKKTKIARMFGFLPRGRNRRRKRKKKKHAKDKSTTPKSGPGSGPGSGSGGGSTSGSNNLGPNSGPNYGGSSGPNANSNNQTNNKPSTVQQRKGFFYGVVSNADIGTGENGKPFKSLESFRPGPYDVVIGNDKPRDFPPSEPENPAKWNGFISNSNGIDEVAAIAAAAVPRLQPEIPGRNSQPEQNQVLDPNDPNTYETTTVNMMLPNNSVSWSSKTLKKSEKENLVKAQKELSQKKPVKGDEQSKPSQRNNNNNKTPADQVPVSYGNTGQSRKQQQQRNTGNKQHANNPETRSIDSKKKAKVPNNSGKKSNPETRSLDSKKKVKIQNNNNSRQTNPDTRSIDSKRGQPIAAAGAVKQTTNKNRMKK